MNRVHGIRVLSFTFSSLLMLLMLLCAGCGGSSGGATALSDGASQTGIFTRGTAAPNQSPEAVPGAIPTAGSAPLRVHFFDAGSTDPDGYIVKWEWNFDNQGEWEDYTDTQGEAECIYENYGTRSPKLRVTDNGGKKDISSILIDIKEWNNADPIAITSISPKTGAAPLNVQFNAEDSYDPDGIITKFEWDFDEGEGFEDFTSTRGKTSNLYDVGDTYTAVLRLTDDDGAQVALDFEIKVRKVYPIAIASADPRSGDPPLSVSFDAVGSYDRDGEIIKYEWDFGEGGGYEDFTSTKGVASHIYSKGGKYWAFLRVTDNDFQSSRDFAIIWVSGGPWSMFGHDPRHTHRSPFVGAQEADLKWTYTTGARVVSSPAIGDDGTVYVGSNDNKLHAVNPDGTAKWTYTTWGQWGVLSSPAIDLDGTVYVGAWDGKLHAINPDSTAKWTYTTGAAVSSSPTVDFYHGIHVGSRDGVLYQISHTGLKRGSFTTSRQIHFSSPAFDLDRDAVYVGSYDGKFYALDPSCQLRWSYPTGGVIFSSPAIDDDGTVYIGSADGKLYAFNPDGGLKWTYATGSYVLSSPAIGADGTVYIGSYDHMLHAVNPDGSSKWTYVTGNQVKSSPAIGADGTLYFTSWDGKLHAVKPDGNIKWSYFMGYGDQMSSPAIGADGTVYVGGADGKLYAFGPSS